MRIGTYNVLKLAAYPSPEKNEDVGRNEPDANRFADAFAELDCDVLALQEGNQSMATMQAIAEQLGDVSVAVFPSPVNWPGYLFTRYPIVESCCFSHFHPEARSRPLSRCAGVAWIDVGEAVPWAVVVLHLYPHREEVERRREEAMIVNDRVKQLLDRTPHVLVMGDFNSEVDERVHLDLKDAGFVNAMETVGGGLTPTTLSLGARKRPIDHIYVSAALGPRLQSAQVVKKPGFYHPGPDAPAGALHSDHLPVVAAMTTDVVD